MRGRPNAQAAFAILRAFVPRWYVNVLQVHTRLEVELDHGRVERGLEQAVRHLKAQKLRSSYNRRSPQYSIVLRVELRVIARHVFAVKVPFITRNYTFKCLNLVTNRLLIYMYMYMYMYIVTQCL